MASIADCELFKFSLRFFSNPEALILAKDVMEVGCAPSNKVFPSIFGEGRLPCFVEEAL